jgi:hypothetical protein
MTTIEDFFFVESDNFPISRSPQEIEVWRRIKLSVAAYAYEIRNESIMSDSEFDEMCKVINPLTKTGNKVMDKFFKEKFDASTGQWIHKHPELSKIKYLYETYYNK